MDKKDIKEIVIISGKGGTGKTSITASFSWFAKENAILADCDVDAADMHLVTSPEKMKEEKFYSGELASLNQEKCTRCGKCIKVCHFDAIHLENQQYLIDPVACEGCGYCSYVCPTQAISMKKALAGELYASKTRMGSYFSHARLAIGADNSGKLVTEVRNQAKQLAEEYQKQTILIDGTPGIGCPVTASVTGTNLVVIVTEPSVSGVHDAERALELIQQFNIPAFFIINKADINLEKRDAILQISEKHNIPVIAELPYHKDFTAAIQQGLTLPEMNNSKLNEKLEQAWKKIHDFVNKP